MEHLQKYIVVPHGVSIVYQQQKPIAPAPAFTTSKKVPSILGMNGVNVMSGPTSGAIVKKKYNYNNMPYGEQLPSVARRNARERNRVKQVNNGFTILRQHIPSSVINNLSNNGRGANKKLSKVDTLRIAVEYIRGLQDLLEDSCQGSSSPSSMPSPYTTDNSSDDFILRNSYNSEASGSPTPSYASDVSNGNNSSGYTHSSNNEDDIQFKFEAFDSYDNMTHMEDETNENELLNYISSWENN